jgi:bacillithiol system protein YtxJ
MILPTTSVAAVEDALADHPVAVIYKHSPRCGSCLAALDEVQRFAAAHPDIPVFQVEVLTQRPVSDAIADRLGVRHASPQVIVVHEERAVWSATHWNVTASALAEQVSRVGANPPPHAK